MMLSSQSSSSSLPTAGVRVPKLRYRQSIVDGESPIRTVPVAPDTISSAVPSSINSWDAASSTRPSSFNPTGTCTPRSASIAVSFDEHLSTTVKLSGKKQSFLSGLFTVKEPSAQAFAEYERQLKAQESTKANRRSTAGLPRLSTASLPPTVPKVNSRWDGIPLSAKERTRKNQLAPKRSFASSSRSVPSSWSNQSSDTNSLPTPAGRSENVSRGTLDGPSVQRGESRNRLAELYGWEGPNRLSGSLSKMSVDGLRPSSERSTSSKSAPPVLVTSRSDVITTEASEPPPIPQAFIEQRSLNNQNSPSTPGLSSSPALTPYESNPATPAGRDQTDFITLSDSGKTLIGHERHEMHGAIANTTLEVPCVNSEVVVRSAGPNILGPPLSARREQKASRSVQKKEPKLTSILKDSSGVSENHQPRGGPASYMHQRRDTFLEKVTSRSNGKSHQSQSRKGKDIDDDEDDDDAIGDEGGERSPSPTPKGGERRKHFAGLFHR